VGRHSSDILVKYGNFSLSNRQIAGNHVKQRCLSSTIWAYQGAALAMRDVHIDVPHCF
jgi:hypothetical protein